MTDQEVSPLDDGEFVEWLEAQNFSVKELEDGTLAVVVDELPLYRVFLEVRRPTCDGMGDREAYLGDMAFVRKNPPYRFRNA